MVKWYIPVISVGTGIVLIGLVLTITLCSRSAGGTILVIMFAHWMLAVDATSVLAY